MNFSIRAFERGEVNFRDLFDEAKLTFESNIAYTLRFMIDTKARFHSVSNEYVC